MTSTAGATRRGPRVPLPRVVAAASAATPGSVEVAFPVTLTVTVSASQGARRSGPTRHPHADPVRVGSFDAVGADVADARDAGHGPEQAAMLEPDDGKAGCAAGPR